MKMPSPDREIRTAETTMPNINDAAISVLIIDDVPSSLALLSRALTQPGLEIITAPDSEEGFDIARRRHPRIVLITPQPNSLDVLERIMEVDRRTHVIRMPAHCSADGGHADNSVSLPQLRERVEKLARELRRQ